MVRVFFLQHGQVTETFEKNSSNKAPQTLQEAALDEPENGVYLVARTWRRDRVLDLDGHFDRMERSASALGREIQIPRDEVRRILFENLPGREDADIRFRVTAVLDDTPWYIISLEETHGPDARILREGVTCAIVPDSARRDPAVKSTAWMRRRTTLAAPRADAPYELLLADAEGHILEGASANFYAVTTEELRTAGEGILEGISRKIVLEVAPDIVPVRLEPVGVADLPLVREAFITSATRGVVPVRRIDATELGPPGPITGRIAAAYNRLLDSRLEPLFC
jgi:branched-chain amino acid aminotransferase